MPTSFPQRPAAILLGLIALAAVSAARPRSAAAESAAAAAAAPADALPLNGALPLDDALPLDNALPHDGDLARREASDGFAGAPLAGESLAAPPVVCAECPEPEACFFESEPRPGVLQQLLHGTTRLMADDGQLALTELDFSATLGFPFPDRDAPLLVTPAFGLDLLDTDGFDLPEELYEASVEFRHLRPLSERWTADLAVAPGVFGNTETSARELRVQGRAVGIYQWRSRAQAVLGVAYLDREDVPLLPVAGLLWTPHAGLQADLLFPRPKLAGRVFGDAHSSWWAHLRGEFGGGSWGVTRAGGNEDIATIRDIRLLAGIERRARWCSFQLEGGFAFARELEYASGVGDTELNDAGVLRAAVWY